MTENQGKPTIRFKGYTEAWEQRKLGDISKIKTGSSDAQDAALEGEYPFFVRSDEIQHSNKYLYDGEAILIPGEGRLGEIYHYINGKFDFHQRVYKISDFDDTNGRFILYEMQRSFKHHALKNTAKATVDSIRLPTLTEYEMQIPSIEEQGLIGTYFKHLDNVITLHQREYDKTINLKKAMLEKMFPKNGEDRPEIRFKGFTDAWEQRKLGGLLQTLPFKTFIKAPEQDGKYEIIQQGNEPIIGYANGIPCNDYKDTVIFGDHTLSLYKPDSSFFVATDGVRIVKGKRDIEGYFLMAMLENYKPHSEGYKRYYSILADCDCYFTKDESEQQQIGAYFKELDNLITLHQRESFVEQLQE